MGIVDRDYLAALTGRSFASDWHAIRYYLKHENEAAFGLSLTPLVEREWLVKQVADTDLSWYTMLLRSPGFLSTSPYFDSRVYAETVADSTSLRSTLDALRHFIRNSEPESIMPVVQNRRGPALTWWDCRNQAINDARLFAEQQRGRPRLLESWDTAAERRFVRRIEGAGGREGPQSLVSIVMSAGDSVQSLEAALHSVQLQSYTNWELLVVSVGSADGTEELLRSVAKDDQRVTHILQEHIGVSAARNRALANLRGDFVAFIDADNSSWLPRYLEYSLAGIKEKSAGIVHCGVRRFRANGAIEYSGTDLDHDDLLAGDVINISSVVASRDVVDTAGGFDESIEHRVDYDFLLRLSESTALEYLPFLGAECTELRNGDAAAVARSPAWEDVVLGNHLIDWVALEGASSTRQSRLVSIIIPTYTDWRMTATAVESVLDRSGNTAIEVIVIDNGSRRHVYAILRALLGSAPHVRILRMARNLNFALSNNLGLSLSRGEYVVSLNNDTEVTEGWLEPLLLPLERDDVVIGTQPLLLYPDGSVQSAGTVFLGEGRMPEHFLSGHPVADALMVTEHDYAAITAAAMCMRADELIALRGFDPLYTNGLEDVDLCLRAQRRRPGVFRVVNKSVVYHHEGRTPGRSRAVTRNRGLFAARWKGQYPSSDEWRYGIIDSQPGED